MNEPRQGQERDSKDDETFRYSQGRRDFAIESPNPGSASGIGQGSFQSAQGRNEPPNQTEQVQRLAGLSIGFSSIFCEQLLSHPCIVLRRQCQVHHAGGWYHLTPLSLLQTVINIQRTQVN
ncbi:solute carrier family 25 member 46-like [Elysia marginata]|uniref:Solute carrier family 25 member 46-like n=1 Tax=Elysia marginata TaxID=1093978 RepID=A0AAV4J570_9GAST|nr:solute carrier family 25 member 46-like [Elysia marginata]